MHKMKKVMGIFVGTGLLSCAHATGVQDWLQSGNSISDFGAGIAATANNPDTSFYNPAGMPWIQRQDMGFSLSTQVSNIAFNGNVTSSPSIPGFKNSGSAQGGSVTYLPTLFYVAPLSPRWAIGFNVTQPYRYNVDYGRNSLLRYQTTDWDFNTIDVSPSLAFRPTPQLSFGIGADFQDFNLHFNQASTTSSAVNDTESRTSLESWAMGWNAGVMWQPGERTRVGFSYRSSISHDPTGNSWLRSNSISHRVHSDVELPSSYIISARHLIGERWTVLGTTHYTDWTKTSRVTLRGIATTNGEVNYTLFGSLQNTWLFATGLNYQASPQWVLKTGLGYQQASSSNANTNLVLPDLSQYVLALGGNYQLDNDFNFDLGFDHFFNKSKQINHTQTTSSGSMINNGTLDTNMDVFGLQLNWLMT